jgi:hypothetical protein
MALASRRLGSLYSQQDVVSPKQREALEKRKTEYLGEMNDRLNSLSDSPYKQELMQKRDHCFIKFPVFPADLNIWVMAYFEDWLRDYDRVPLSFR